MNDTYPDVRAHKGFFPLVSGTSVQMEQALSAAVLARDAASIANGGTSVLLANGPVSIANGGAQTVVANGSVDICQGGAALTVARQVDVRNGTVGIALARHIRLNESRVILGPASALFLGAGLALGAGLLAGRRRYRASA